MAKRIKVIPVTKNKDLKNNKGRPAYRTSKNAAIILTENQKVKAVKLFDMAKNILVNTVLDVDINSKKIQYMAEHILGHIEFDIDAGSRPLEQAVERSDIRGGIQKYLKSLS